MKGEKTRIFVIDDEIMICRSCRKILSLAGYQVDTSQSSRAALERIKEEAFDLVILDIKMPGIDGMELLKRIKKIDKELVVIMITGYSTVESAVQAMKLGVYDYLPKPFTPEELSVRVERALANKQLERENQYLQEELQDRYGFGKVIGKSSKMKEVFELIKKVASADSTVLINGESGTGKELIARSIHFNSKRCSKRFVCIDCSALTETLLESELFGHVKGSFTGAVATKHGLIEIASGGTLFLDEVGDVAPSTQAKLLRVLQEREIKPVGATNNVKIDIRLVVATNKDLQEQIGRGGFREDLYYRLNVVPISLPPLRERKGDICLLIDCFIAKMAGKRNKDIQGFTPKAKKALETYHWPGNVRELENIVERMVVMNEGEMIDWESLPSYIKMRGTDTRQLNLPRNSEELSKVKKTIRDEATKEVERLFVVEALKRNGWNISKTAQDVGMQRQNLQKLIRKHQVSTESE